MRFLLRSISFLFLVSCFINTFVSPTRHLCRPDQRDALLEFKSEFGVDSDVLCYPKTESWVNKSDCCSWDGITCDAKTGQVVGLDLDTSCLHGRFKSNSSLFRLSHLRDLNLAYNNFAATPFPVEFDKLEGLERLNLSMSSFSGQIPSKLLGLTKLVSLDLSSFPPEVINSSSRLYVYPPNSLSVDESFLPLLARNLRSLRDLDMSCVNISSKIPHEFSTMWSLRLLRLWGCSLFGEFPSSVFLLPNLQTIVLSYNQNLSGSLPVFHGDSSLQILKLSYTSFSGIIPDSIGNLKHLTAFRIGHSNFSGRIPFSLGSLSHLSCLYLSHNHFSGEIPSSLGNLTHLSFLHLSDNSFSGEIPSSIGNLKQLAVLIVFSSKLSGNFPSTLLNLTQLLVIDLSFNKFTGVLPPNISQLSKLKVLDMHENSFIGAIPSSLFKISSLAHIHLGFNKLSVMVGIENVSLLTNLEFLFLGNNKFVVSPVDLNVFSPLKHLVCLSLSDIPFSTENISPDFLPQLESLYLSRCNITEFPKFLRNQRNLQTLYLSHNKIKGQVPDWLWALPKLSIVYLYENFLSGFLGSLEALSKSKIVWLHLGLNAFQGPLPIPPRDIEYYSVSENNFTGGIPRSLCGLTYLQILDLSNNDLHGPIPRCLETHMSSLSDLDLHNNSLSGSLPDIFMHAKELKALDVSQNRFEGNLPASLTSCFALEILNVGSNRFNDMFPFQLNSLQKLQVFVLRDNKFHGRLHQSDGVWVGFPRLKIFDVSQNDFVGTLPSDFFLNWTMVSSKGDTSAELDYIHGNSLYNASLVLMSKGVSMEMKRIRTTDTSIDFSGNQLHGQIPDSIGRLKELRILNLSSNAFTGHIPPSLANLTNLESLDLSQNNISGEIPPALGTLSSLAWIDISHNQLVGSIPQGTQFLRQNCSSYEGNPGLNRQSLKEVCEDIHSPTPPQPEPLEPNKEEEDDEWINWLAVGIGFAPGIVFGLTIGYIVASHKIEWFMKTFGLIKQ